MMRIRQILRSTFMILVLILVPPTSAFAHQSGETLRFDNEVNLSLEITEELRLKQVGDVVYQSGISAKNLRPFSRILINGMLPDSNLLLEIKYETSEGEWGNWLEAPMKIFENGRFWARVDLENLGLRLKYRFVNLGIKTRGTIEIYAVEGGDVQDSDPDKEVSVAPPVKVQFLEEDSVEKPSIISRQEWGAQEPVGAWVPHDPFRFTQHHTAGRRIETLEDGMIEMRFIQDFHQNGRGWSDIGYHYCIDDRGRIYEGVPPDFRGTHVGGANTGNIGISYFGNFDIAGEYPTIASLENLVQMWSWLAFEYPVKPDMLLGHRDYTPTACPGANLYSKLGEMRNNIRKVLQFGGPYVANPEPQPFSFEVSPDRSITFSVRDNEEGVDINSIVVRINNETVTGHITGSPQEYFITYQPEAPFPSSQNVLVEVEADDLAAYANSMFYSYHFTIEVQALHIEIETTESMRNADLEISGRWSSDDQDVDLSDLIDGHRLFAIDDDGSHSVRFFPRVEVEGDYRVLMAVNGQFLGESAHYRFVNAAGMQSSRIAEYNSAFDGRWSVLSPTPVHFDRGEQSGAFVELSGLDDLETMLVLDAFRLERVDRLDRPTAPTLKWVRVINSATREIEVAWYPSLEADIEGYRLFMSKDGTAWSEPLVDETTLTSSSSSHTLIYTGTASRLYFRIIAVDNNGVESEDGQFEPFLSEPTDTYGVGFARTAEILIVDNFDRRQSWPLSYHSFVRSHGDAIAANRNGFDSCTETAVQTGEIELADYDAVVYFCGDDSRFDESLAAADQYRLLEYLENGGKLLISGSEIGYDFDATTSTELERTQNLLKAAYLGDLSGSNRILGADQTPFEGLDFVFGTLNSEDTYIEDYPDYILPAGGSQIALIYDNSRIAAVHYTGAYGNGYPDAQLIYIAFTFETINEAQDRARLMKSALQYFGIPAGVGRLDEPWLLPIYVE